MALFDDASLVTTPNGYKAGTLYSIKPTSGAGDMDVVRATTATRVNSAGLIESVANNVPRLDYSNGTCPSLLVEPQRTNLFTYSEQLQTGTGGTITVTPNTTISPDGTQNADSLGAGYLTKSISATSGTWTYSAFVKYLSSNTVNIYIYDGVYYDATFNVSTGVVTSSSAGVTASIQNMGNGWYRCIMTATTANNVSEVGFNSGNVYAWGCQLEAGSYPTSYIPTTSSAVTRNADVISKTGISSLIGQTEGVLFLDLFASAKNDDTNTYGTWLVAGTATENFQIYNLGTTLYWYVRLTTGGAIIDQTANQTIVEGTRYKIAIAYKSGDYALYINGVQKRTSANANVPAVSQFNLSAGGYGASPAIVKNEYNSAVLFPTRLTNAELAQLTTI